MAADSNTSFEFQIASESKEAEKGIDKIIDVAKDLEKEIGKIESKLEALKSKSGILFGQAQGEKISKDTAKEKQRLNYVLQYYAIQEKIQKIANKATADAQKQAEAEAKAATQAKKKADAEEKARLAMEEARKAQVIGAISGVGNFLKNLGGNAIQKIISPFQRLSKSLKTLMSSVGRIAFYRAIRSGIKAVTQGFSEGIKHLYAWSEAFNTKFAPAMDQYKTQMTYLHNGFAAMFSPLIEWVIPNVLTPLTDAMVEFFNLVQQGFATLVGHDYWYKAQKSMTKFGEATKKANIQLAKFDELNNLTETGSGSEEDASGMFTLEKVSADFGKGFFKEIRDEIKNGDWYGVGNTIADKLNEGIGNFDARGLASTIASKINNAINLVLGFSENFGWDELGTKIGGFIDQAIGDINWKNLGSAGGNLVGGLLTMILSAIEEIDVAKAVDAFFDFWDGLFGSLGSRLFEDNGYHVKMLALKLAEFAVAVVYNGFIRFRQNLKKLNIFNTGLGLFYSKINGFSVDEISQMQEITENYNYLTVIDNIHALEDELKQSHGKFLDDQQRANEQAADKERKTAYVMGKDIADTMGKTGQQAVANYVSAPWGTQKPYLNILSALNSADIPLKTKLQGQEAVNAYANSVDWKNGGKVSADGILWALFNAGIPLKFAGEASASIASMVNTYYSGQTQVTNALNQMTNGFDGTNTGRNIGQQIVSGMNSVLVSSPIASPGGGRSNYRITLTPNARGGYLFANGGFASGLSQGTMYVAGEVPGQAEMVGQINGRTGVASGFEITGIRDAVISTGENEAQLLQRLISVLEKKNLVISPSAQLGRVMAQSNRLYSGVTG